MIDQLSKKRLAMIEVFKVAADQNEIPKAEISAMVQRIFKMSDVRLNKLVLDINSVVKAPQPGRTFKGVFTTKKPMDRFEKMAENLKIFRDNKKQKK